MQTTGSPTSNVGNFLTDVVERLKIARYRFIVQPQEQIFLPEYKGSTFRGAFGTTFKKICCFRKQSVCSECLLKDKCAYSFIFESSPSNSSKKLRNLEEIPRPFVIEPPLTEKNYFVPGDKLDFNLVLIGKAIEYLPYIVYTFIEMGKRGIGKNGGSFKVEKVINQKSEVIYDGKSEIINNNNSLVKIETPEKDIGNTLKLSFLTPTRIKYQGHYIDRPEFHIIVRSLLRRISLLMYFYCGQELNIDFKNLIFQSENVKISNMALRWVDWQRYSSRQDTKMKLGGFVGDVIYAGDIKQFFPFLFLGECIHIGKNCTFGLGKYKIIGTR